MNLKEQAMYIHQQALMLQEKIVFGNKLNEYKKSILKTRLKIISTTFEGALDIINNKEE